MPCNKMAVAAGQMTIDPAFLFTANGLAAVCQQMLPLCQQKGYGDQVVATEYWQREWSQLFHGGIRQHDFQAVADGARELGYVDFAFRAAAVRLYLDGKLEVRDGWDQSDKMNRSTKAQQELLDFASGLTSILAQIYQQQAVVEALAQMGDIVYDSGASTAGRVFQLALEV